jgi:CBS-domain-containing membrane protein
MKRMKRAGEIMIPLENFPHIPFWFTLRQAMAELERAESDPLRPKNVPWVILVFDAQYKLLGIVRRRDILQGLMPNILDGRCGNYPGKLLEVQVDPRLYEMSFNADHVIRRFREQIEKPVSSFMSPIEVTVDDDENIIPAIYQMIGKNLSFIPVLRQGHFVGMLYAMDVLQEMASLAVEGE